MLVRNFFISPPNHFTCGRVCFFRARVEEETFTGVTRGVLGKAVSEIFSRFSYGRRSVGVAQHGVEGAGEVVGVVAAVVLLRHGNQAGQADEEQEEKLDGERSPEDPQQEGGTL